MLPLTLQSPAKKKVRSKLSYDTTCDEVESEPDSISDCLDKDYKPGIAAKLINSNAQVTY